MKLFKCTQCENPVYFENTSCDRCKYQLGFEVNSMSLFAIKTEADGSYSLVKHDDVPNSGYRYCANHQYQVCNWLVAEGAKSDYCVACNLNRTIPDLAVDDNLRKWSKIEIAKHRLIYALLRFNLPVNRKTSDAVHGILFDFLADTEGQPRVLTGHANGLVTLNIAEADDIEREMMRKQMDEIYRTLLGHFRHEIGHYYWEVFFLDHPERLSLFRKIFGDERADYGESLQRHYEQGTPKDWEEHYISAYAAAHPWEDWAETWAHYLHMVGTLETAYAFGVTIDPLIHADKRGMSTRIDKDPYLEMDFEEIIGKWLPLTFAMNSLNRSMGLKDPYPFIITPSVLGKLQFIHNAIHQQWASV
ncbi:zinc-binding metallopeptidase family protein [Olivibacter sitiensis]|uniref:zinc-binding metallopeptidase family protein n=1 Tax=Olivibacter sitiensis TaxID=376470 RepID=UPI0004863D66|nr:putative zinc-binding peptidase [Olivibacter sitiensis]